MFTTYSLVKDALKILMESVPETVDFGEIEKELLALGDVINVHDLHVWNLSVGKIALSVHLVVSPSTVDINGNVIPSCLDGVLRSAQRICRDKHGIEHCTIQIEWPHSNRKETHCPPYCENHTKLSYMSPNGSTLNERIKNENGNGNKESISFTAASSSSSTSSPTGGGPIDTMHQI